MFTGIVKGIGEIYAITKKENFNTITVRMPLKMVKGLETGASVAINGCCLTVTGGNKDLVFFDIMRETLRVTNLGKLAKKSQVNLERAARFGDEVGGHQVSGHILCTATVHEIVKTDDNCTMWFTLPSLALPYVFHKGYIAINGVSLTIGIVEKERFCVYLIPETLRQTTMGTISVGDKVNIEADPQIQAVVDTVQRLLPDLLNKKTG